MKNKDIIIILIILLAVMVIGLIAFLVVCLKSGDNFLTRFGNWGRNGTAVILDKSYEFQKIDKIEISSNAGDVKIEKGMDENVRVVVYGKEPTDVTVSQNENELRIDTTRVTRHWSFFSSYVNDIIVYVPESYSGEMAIKNSYGNCKVVDLENTTMTIDSDCGDIDLQKIKNVKIKCDYGDVDIGSVLNHVEVEASCGDIEIDNLLIKENSSIKCDYGDIKIKHAESVYVDADVDLGDVKIKENDRSSSITLTIMADCGDVKVGE